MDQDQLVRQLHSGDPEAFIRIMESYNKLLWVIVGGVLKGMGTVEDIEECISDVYVSLWRNPESYDPRKGSLRIFLAAVSKHKALDRYRQLAKAKTMAFDEAVYTADDDLSEYIAKQNLYGELYEAIRSLKEPDREILTRRYFLDEKPSGIAGRMSIPVKEVENRLYQTKLRLRKFLRSKEVIEYES